MKRIPGRSIFLLLLVVLLPQAAWTKGLDEHYRRRFAELFETRQRSALAVESAATHAAGHPAAERCLTPLFHGVSRDWKSLSLGTQDALARYLAKPVLQNRYISIQGHFTIHFNPTGADAPPPGDANGNGVPDWVEKVAEVFEHVYHHQTVVMGYRPAPTLNGAPYDVYLQNLAPVYFGRTESGVSVGGHSFTSYIVIDNDFAESVYAPHTGISGLQLTAAHEYHHAIQYGYNYYFDIWYAEATSVWIEDEVYDAHNQLYGSSFLLDYMRDTRASLDAAAGSGYGRWIFNRHLAERHGTGVIRAIWERLAQIPPQPGGADIPMLPVIDQTLRSAPYASSLADDFLLFARKLYTRDWTTRRDEIPLIPALVPAAGYSGYPVTGVSVPAPSVTLPHHAFTHFTFSPSPGAPRNLVLDVAAAPGITAVALKRLVDGTLAEHALNPATGAITIADFNTAGAVREVALLIVNPGSEDNRTAHFSAGVRIRGDLNDDRKVDLRDVVLALRTMAGADIGFHPDGDVDSDGRAGLPEAIYVLQTAAGIR